MHTIVIAAAVSCLCAWTYLLFARARFWYVSIDAPVPVAVTRVTAVVPARNEADVVDKCVASLLSQANVDIRVVLVDDASTDPTSDTARTTAANVGAADRLTTITSSVLPAGWTGKLWAVSQGVERALAGNPEFLLLTDADIEHGPNTVGTLIAIAQRDRLDLASYMVKLRCNSLAERLLIPAFVYFFFKLYPPAWIADPQSRTAGAAGGCMLVRPEALQRAGGIASIRSEIIDDCALARAIKRSGGRTWLGLTNSSHSLRSYGTFADVSRMISRTAFNQLHHSTLLLLGTIIGMFVTYIAPVALLATGDRVPMLAGGGALAAMVASYLPMVRFYRLHPLWALTLPVAAIFYAGATVWSALLYWSGRGGQWKGRAQDHADVAAR